jgi:ATP-dependent DNA helicase RecG
MASPLDVVAESAALALASQSTKPARLAETLVALANGAGGRLVVGVDPRTGKPEGLVDPELVLDRALQAALAAEPPLIIPLPRLVQAGDAQVLEITVPAGLPHVYAWQGHYLVREGARNRALAPRLLRRLMMERGAASFECVVPEQASLDDLGWDRVERYLTALGGVSRNAQDLLLRRGCLGDLGGQVRPTVAGLLLFGRDPLRWVRSGQILVVRYSGRSMTDRFVKEEIRGTLPDQIHLAEASVVANMQKGVHLSGLERIEEGEYPPAAVREVIVNAVAHRDYQIRGEEIRILLFSDRIECYSPGRLPGHVTLENLVEERFSRNEAIVQVLSDMGFIERLGYGIDRIIRLMADAGLPEPRFEETAGGFRVTLFGGAGAPSSVDASRRWRQLGLSDRQERALVYLTERGRITNREYQELCPDVSAETIRRDLADLVSKDLLLRIGDKKATYYILK